MFLGAEFLSFVLLVVYIGALAVLFLFIVMLLDLRLFSFYSRAGKDNFFSFEKKYIVLFSFFFSCLLIISFAVNFNNFFVLSFFSSNFKVLYLYSDFFTFFYSYTNIYVFGLVLYTLCFFPFLLTGVLLLVALIAAINITLSSQSNLISQVSYIQILRSSNLNLS